MTSTGRPGAPTDTTSSSGVGLSDNCPTGTMATAVIDTSRYTITVMPRPVSMTLGKIRDGSLVSSAMLTESSKPTKEKKASEVAAVMARKTLLSFEVSKTITRLKSALPWLIAQNPMTITISRPANSTRVSTTLNLTDSLTPRKLIAARTAMKMMATQVTPVWFQSRLNPAMKFSPKNLAAVEADVMPELSTANVTKKVRKWIPKALCVYSAAPAACGYFVTNSR